MNSEIKMAEKYDLHAHGFTTWKKGLLERKPREPWCFLDGIKKAGLDGIVLTNFAGGSWETAYEEFSDMSNDREKLKEYRLVKKLKNALVFTDKKEEKLIKVIKGQEFSTVSGPEISAGRNHMMAIALDYGTVIPNEIGLETSLKRVGDVGAIANADHCLTYLGIGRENLEKYAGKGLIDVWEAKNMNYEHEVLKFKIGKNLSIQEADKLAKQLGINWIAVSDCHNFKDIGNGHVEVEAGFDFSSKDNLKDSMRETLRKRNFIPVVREPNSLASVIAHATVLSFYGKYVVEGGWGDKVRKFWKRKCQQI